MVKQSVAERRKNSRAKRVLSIQFREIRGRNGKACESWGLSTTEDLSFDGLSFYTDREYFPKSILELHVIMSGVLDVFQGRGKVVRVSRKKLGVCSLVAVKLVKSENSRRDFGGSHRSTQRS